MKQILFTTALTLFAQTALADAPVVVAATASQSAGGWTIAVTISHPEKGRDHYADGWEVLDPDGNSLGVRVLAHPHVNEQPFTRSLGSVQILPDLDFISIRARDNVDGWYENLFRIELEN